MVSPSGITRWYHFITRWYHFITRWFYYITGDIILSPDDIILSLGDITQWYHHRVVSPDDISSSSGDISLSFVHVILVFWSSKLSTSNFSTMVSFKIMCTMTSATQELNSSYFIVRIKVATMSLDVLSIAIIPCGNL